MWRLAFLSHENTSLSKYFLGVKMASTLLTVLNFLLGQLLEATSDNVSGNWRLLHESLVLNQYFPCLSDLRNICQYLVSVINNLVVSASLPFLVDHMTGWFASSMLLETTRNIFQEP